MKITVKKLQGDECCLEVVPTTSILEIKRQTAKRLKIPVEEQKLLFVGRTLLDEHTVQNYPNIKDGSKLNLVVKKPDGLYEVSAKYFKQLGMTESEAKAAASRLLIVVQEKFNKLSWDDVNRLCEDCLREMDGENSFSRTLTQADCDDI